MRIAIVPSREGRKIISRNNLKFFLGKPTLSWPINASIYSKLFSVAVVKYPDPILRAIKINAQGGIEMVFPEARNTRTQDLEEFYHDVDMFYCGTREGFFSEAPMFSESSPLIEIDRKCAHGIDEPADWEIAELAFKNFVK